jgi:four helix bundle protein
MEFNYEKLDVTKRVKQLMSLVYVLSKEFPDEERFGMTSQVRRTVVSVLLNVAEGSSRKSKKEFARFVNIAIGSLVETDALMKFAHEIDYIALSDFEEFVLLVEQIYYPLVALRKSMQTTELIEQGAKRRLNDFNF